MGFSIYPVTASAISTSTGWTAGVAGTFLLSNTLTAGTYIINTDSTQTMTITLVDSAGHAYAGTIRGGSGFITTATDTNQIKIPGSLTYPFGITINPIAVPQLAAPTSVSLTFNEAIIITGTWGTVPADATGAVLLTPTGDVLNFSSTASGATVNNISITNTIPGTVNQFVVAFKNSSGAIGLGTTFSLAMPAAYSSLFEYLVVGAGGASAGAGAGGGAVKTATEIPINIGNTFTLSVAPTTTYEGANGQSSTLTYGATTITATGGASAPTITGNGNSGSSGAGGYNNSNTGTSYPGGTGTDGGNGGESGNGVTYPGAGGGGGAGGSGAGYNSGNGVASSITGSSIFYAGGGAGGKYSNSGTVGSGGTPRSNPGLSNTGAGAGAGGYNFVVNGGSGVIILVQPTTQSAITTIPGTLTYTLDTTTRTGYRIYKFTAGSGTVTV